ncbi:hypothetical protein B0H19DRAFT_1079013 [Mycena capillaripes]|nr:hypothetical protein B0H19DRAFT_1079013 [Mycena capillaripes]
MPKLDTHSTTDLGYSQANLGIGECLISVHEPAEAASWVENNWDSSLLTSIRNSGRTGPVAWMVSPAEPALAIFGNLDNPVVANMAESLAQASVRSIGGSGGIDRETEIPTDLEDLTRFLSQPGVMALVDFGIETRPRETQIDRSKHRQIQRGIKGALGFAQGSPLATANSSYNRNNDTTLEVPGGLRNGDEGHKSYSSYNIAYQLQGMRLDAERSEFHPLEARPLKNISVRTIVYMNEEVKSTQRRSTVLAIEISSANILPGKMQQVSGQANTDANKPM